MSGLGRSNSERPGDEMFLESPSNHTPPPPSGVSPLRIVKRDSTTPSIPSPGPASRTSSTSLPYPDDRPRQQHQQQMRDQNTPVSRQSTGNASPASAGSGPTDIPDSLRARDRRDPKQAHPTLAERRGAAPKPLPESPIPESPDREGLFQRPVHRAPAPATQKAPEQNQARHQQQEYWPPPAGGRAPTSSAGLLQPQPTHNINRISSTASTSTTKAERGSPPPPETPITGPGRQPASDIEARYAASGIAGTSTLNNFSSAAQQRANQYAGQQPRTQQQQQPVQRPWTPTEQPGTQPHGPPTVYQGAGEAVQHPPAMTPQSAAQPQSGMNPQPAMSPLPTVHQQPGMIPQPATSPPPGTHQQPGVHPQAGPHSQQLPVTTQAQYQNPPPHNALEDEFQRLNMTASPPPAYSSLAGPAHAFSHDKQNPQGGQQTPVGAAMAGAVVGPPPGTTQALTQSHPAFANEQRPQSGTPVSQNNIANGQQMHPQPSTSSTPAPTVPPSSPPPLPEGWIAHLDPNSGQYYYIHLASQSTQWEFPKGPTPLNLNETPLSPTHSTFSGLTSPGLSTFGKPLPSPAMSAFGQPLPSPGMPMTPGYEGSVMSFNSGYTGPPPVSGVELYKVAPTNGVYFGPYLRYKNMDIERGAWLGSILLVTDAPQPPTIHLHKSVDLSPNPRQLSPQRIAAHQRWTFYKYEIDIPMDDHEAGKWTYAITSHLGCTRYEFLVAGRHETNWRFIATSGNDFSLNVNGNERTRLGGVGYMWKDIMQKHAECGGFHAQLGLGSQISADRLWKELPSLKQWLAISGKEARKNAAWSAVLEEDVTHAYFHYYSSHFDQPHLREAFAQIPHVCQVDDHDIFDGFGSYPDYMQFSNMFKNIGRIGIEMYLLFQHHTTLEILRHVSDDSDLFTVTGTGWHFVKYLGPAIAVAGIDCRSERNPHQVLAGPTYQGIFPKIATLPQSVQHCIWMISVPIVYPRLESAEHFVQTVATGKKAVTGAYNMLGKVTSSVAGVVGAKGAVGSGFDSVKRAVGKTGLMGGVLNPFGDIDLLDGTKDQWTHESKDLERTYLIRTLQGIAHQRSIRMTFLSGSVNSCGAGLVHNPSHPTDHKTMYQIISSSVVNTPPGSYILKLLNSNNKPLYIPANGTRSTPSVPTDTKEDMIEVFQADPSGTQREQRKLMGRRNYVAIVGYDPESVNAAYGTGAGFGGMTAAVGNAGTAPGAFPKLSLAVDFLVQGDSAYGNVAKYGPVIVPSLELGR